MRKKIIVAAMVIVLFNIYGLALAQRWEGGPSMEMGPGSYSGGPHSGIPGPWKTLDLSSDQIQKIQVLWEKFFKETSPLRTEVMSQELELQALWLKADPDAGKILAKQKEINSLRAQLEEKAIKNRLEMLKILTPEQQAKLAEQPPRPPDCREEAKGYAFGPGPGPRPGIGMGFGPR